MTKHQKPGRAAAPPQDIKISLTPTELRFLMQALRDVPLSGKPDMLQQLLPIVQGLRLKVASAAQVLASAQGAIQLSPSDKPTPDKAPAKEPEAASD